MCMGACLLKYMIESYVTCKFKKKQRKICILLRIGSNQHEYKCTMGYVEWLASFILLIL